MLALTPRVGISVMKSWEGGGTRPPAPRCGGGLAAGSGRKGEGGVSDPNSHAQIQNAHVGGGCG